MSTPAAVAQGDATRAYPAAFVSAVNRVLADEGGFVRLGADPGGATKFGISQRDYPSLDIRDLTREQAVAIYFRDFWSRWRYSELPEAIAIKLFDLAINIGPSHSTLCLQRALRACGNQLTEDGALGPETVAAAVDANSGTLRAALRSEAAAYYRVIAATWPGGSAVAERDFLEGWLNRAYE